MSYHHVLNPEDAHVIHSWTYANIRDRDDHIPEEGSTDPITADDVARHRICYVRSTQCFYFLIGLTTWKQLNP